MISGMEHVIVLILGTALVLLLKSRVHVHVSLSDSAKFVGRGATDRSFTLPSRSRAKIRPTTPDVESDVASALVNQGLGKQQARVIAKRCCASGGDFDSCFRMALKEAA
jgi:hypothetical protein